MHSCNTMPRNNPDNSAETFWCLSKAPTRFLTRLGQIFCVILPFSEAAHLLLTRSTISLSIINLQIPKGIPNIENSLESSTAVPFLAKSSSLQLPEISLYAGIHVIQTSYRFASSLRHLRRLYTVFEFITLESNALMAVWLWKSMEIFRL